jgi:hypothetical protein
VPRIPLTVKYVVFRRRIVFRRSAISQRISRADRITFDGKHLNSGCLYNQVCKEIYLAVDPSIANFDGWLLYAARGLAIRRAGSDNNKKRYELFHYNSF